MIERPVLTAFLRRKDGPSTPSRSTIPTKLARPCLRRSRKGRASSQPTSDVRPDEGHGGVILCPLSRLPDQLDVYSDFDIVADQKAAGLERHVPLEPEVLAVDLGFR